MEEKISFSVTTYEGFEDEVLHLRNRNRPDSKTREYMDWRYLGEKSSVPPLIFWARHANGLPVGMASLIARPYWIDNHLRNVFALGDISLDHHVRGKYLGKKLIHFMNSYLYRELKQPAFVIPNTPINQILKGSEWHRACPFFWYLWVLDPIAKLIPFLAESKFCLAFKAGYRFLMLKWLGRFSQNSLKLIGIDYIDESFDDLWEAIPKKGVVIRDRSADSLCWRFENHPSTYFQIKKLTDGRKNLGYIIFTVDGDGLCRIVDLLVLKRYLIIPMITLFLREQCKNKNISCIRIKLSSNHIYSESLKSIGFIRRQEKDIFQFYLPSYKNAEKKYNWLITIADKDT